jgi:hypothetical protein
MKRLNIMLILISLICSFTAVAEQSVLKPQTQGDVTFVSGGIGTDEQNEMQAVRADYNLNLLFSVRGTGEYVSDVKVMIADSSGNTVLDSVSDGPMLFALLKPGRYSISVDRDGHVLHKKVTVGSKKRASLSFYWPKEMGDD